MKTRAKNYLATLNDKEARDFLKGMNKLDIWRMAEGSPQEDITTGGEKLPAPILGGISVKHDKQEG